MKQRLLKIVAVLVFGDTAIYALFFGNEGQLPPFGLQFLNRLDTGIRQAQSKIYHTYKKIEQIAIK